MLVIENEAQFGHWTNTTQAILAPFAGLKSLTGFDPSGLSRFLVVQFQNITVKEYRDTLTSILEEARDANFAVLAPSLPIIKLQLRPFVPNPDDLVLLDELIQNDISRLESDIAVIRRVLKDANLGAKMEKALDNAFTGSTGATEGADDLKGDGGANVLDLLGGDDVYKALGGHDEISGGAGRDIIDGGKGDDTLNGGADFDRLLGGLGNDKLNGDTGGDRLIGGAGRDTLSGGAGADDLRGQDGSDRLLGGSGKDTLLGGAGNDLLRGGDNADTLSAGTGRDTLTGGKGPDTFVFTNNSGNNLITDFRNNQDTLELNLPGVPTISPRDWLKKNAEVVNGDVVIEFGNTAITVDGIARLRPLFDDLDLI